MPLDSGDYTHLAGVQIIKQADGTFTVKDKIMMDADGNFIVKRDDRGK